MSGMLRCARWGSPAGWSASPSPGFSGAAVSFGGAKFSGGMVDGAAEFSGGTPDFGPVSMCTCQRHAADNHGPFA
jgi:hypothetical protein